MELADLIAAVKAAATKDALEALVKSELSLDLDKRKSLKSLRAEVLKGLGETVEEGDGDDDDASGEGAAGDSSAPAGGAGEGGAPADTSAPAAPTPAPTPTSVPVAAAPAAASEPTSAPAPAPVTPPVLEEMPEPEIAPAEGNRLLRHKTTGRTFVWTPALSKLSDLEEV